MTQIKEVSDKDILDSISKIFRRTVVLEDITKPAVQEYDEVIEAWKTLLRLSQELLKKVQLKEGSEFTEVCTGLLNTLIQGYNIMIPVMERLRDKAVEGTKYSFFEYKKDMKEYRRVFTIRKMWGSRLNRIKNSL